MSVIAISNKVNSPVEQEVNVAGLDDTLLLDSNNKVSFAGNTIVTTDPDPRAILATVAVGKYLTVSGTTSGLNDGTFLVTAVDANGSSTTITVNKTFTTQPIGAVVTIKQREFFVDESAAVGSSTYSKYVTRRVNLAASSTFVRARYAANIPSGATVELYYKTAPVGSTAPFEDLPYQLMPLDAPIVLAQNGSNDFYEVGCSTGDILPFDAIQVKVVMKSTNSAAVPRIRDLRIIACA